MVAAPQSPEAKLYLDAAAAVGEALAAQEDNGVRQFPEIKISDD